MRRLISRNARDQWDAWDIAQGMENAGAAVFSISYDGQQLAPGATLPASRFIVWAWVDGNLSLDYIDAEIDKERGRNRR